MGIAGFAVESLSLEDLELAGKVRELLLVREVRPPDWRDTHPESRRKFYDAVRGALIQLDGKDINRRAQRISDALSGVGLLEPLLRDPLVEEIFVRNGQVALERDGQFISLGMLAPDAYFYDLTVQIADQSGNTLRPDRPAVLTDLPSGERFTAIVPPLSIAGTAINVRTFGRRVRTMQDLEQAGTFSNQPVASPPNRTEIRNEDFEDKITSLQTPAARYLVWLVARRAGSLLIAGEFSGGKTTLLNALSEFIPPAVPVAALETFRELDLQHGFPLRVVAPVELPPGQPGVTLDWVLNVIYTRMNPGMILVGEVVSAEALQFLKAAGLGRKAITTIHGDSVEAALQRLEQLTLEAQPELGLAAVRSMIALALDVVAVMSRCPRSGGGIERLLREVVLIRGLDEYGHYRLERLFSSGGGVMERRQQMEDTWQALSEIASNSMHLPRREGN